MHQSYKCDHLTSIVLEINLGLGLNRMRLTCNANHLGIVGQTPIIWEGSHVGYDPQKWQNTCLRSRSILLKLFGVVVATQVTYPITSDMAVVREAVEVVVEGGKAWLLKVDVVDHKKFYQVSWQDRKFESLLVSGCIKSDTATANKRRSQASIEINKVLKELHDDHVFKLVNPLGRRKKTEYRQRRYSAKENALYLEHAGTVFTVYAPTYGDVQGIPIKMLVNKPNEHKLSIEISNETVRYLIAVVKHLNQKDVVEERDVEIDGGGQGEEEVITPQKRTRHHGNVTDMTKKGIIVGVRVRLQEGGKIKNKIIRCDSHTHAAAKVAAQDHINRAAECKTAGSDASDDHADIEEASGAESDVNSDDLVDEHDGAHE